jgi:hypothetical protein
MIAGPVEFHHCPWSVISPDSMEWMQQVDQWSRPWFQGWGHNDVPAIVSEVDATYRAAEAEMRPFVQAHHRKLAEADAKRTNPRRRLKAV